MTYNLVVVFGGPPEPIITCPDEFILPVNASMLAVADPVAVPPT